MEYIIGISRQNIALHPLVEHRLPQQSILNGSMQIKKEADNYIWIELCGPAQVLALAEILADIIIETMQIKFLMHEIRFSYGITSEREQCELLIETVKRLWKQEGKSGIERQKAEIGRRIAKYMLEESHLLSLDGIFRFRMQDYLACWQATLEQVVQEFILRREQKEFIKLLRYLVSMKDPGAEFVCIRLEAGEYVMRDCRGREICFEEYIWEEDYTREDRLVSRLVELSPEVIQLDDIQDEVLVQLLREIFIGRVRRKPEQIGQ